MNSSPQSRPEAELPEVTDDGCVCGWGDGPHGKKDCDNDLPPPFAMYVGTHEDEHGKVTAMVEVFGDAGGQKHNLYTDAQVRAALQAAYGQQCAATRPAEVGGDGFAVVRVDSQGVSFGQCCWISHEKITGYSAKSINEAGSPTLKAYREWMQAALPPTPGSEAMP